MPGAGLCNFKYSFKVGRAMGLQRVWLTRSLGKVKVKKD